MMDTSVTIENLNTLAAIIPKTPIIKMLTDKRSAFNHINHQAIYRTQPAATDGTKMRNADAHAHIHSVPAPHARSRRHRVQQPRQRSSTRL
jgi:hypothetical protein